MATEKRLIDASELSEQMAANFEQCVYGGVDSAECQIALDTISEAPTVDAVEVVRCKDCDYRVFDDVCKEYYCNCVYGMYGAIADNDFCSYGERRS